jgi:hypothetical protein
MNRLEIQSALYDARDNYLKAKKQVEFYKREIAFLKECERNLDRDIYTEMYGDTPLYEEVYGG